MEYHTGTLHGKNVVVCCAGMGKANAAATVQVLVTRYGAAGAIIFSGGGGNLSAEIGIGDVVVGRTVLYHDRRHGHAGPERAFLDEYPGDPALVQAAMDACAACGVKAIAGRIATRRPLYRRQQDEKRQSPRPATPTASRWRARRSARSRPATACPA